jgi:hypothetical protein
MRNNKVIAFLTISFALIAVIKSQAIAGLETVQKSTYRVGATTITWDSSFQNMDYILGDTILMVVNWKVDKGAAKFKDFVLKEFTPEYKNDPVIGELLRVTLINDSQNGTGDVGVEFKFTNLHFDKNRNVELGNSHFKLLLNVDKNGDGIMESTVSFGVNAHVEIPFPYRAPDELMTGFKLVVQERNIDNILKYFDTNVQDKYRSLFESNIDQLPKLSEELKTLEAVQMGENIAVYKYKFTDEEGDLLTDHIFMEKRIDGIWRIISF